MTWGRKAPEGSNPSLSAMGKLMKFLIPKPSSLTAREFSEEILQLFHHVDEYNKASIEASLLRGKQSWQPKKEEKQAMLAVQAVEADHWNLAHEASERIGQVKVRFTGKITKSEQRWTKGREGLIGSSHPYTHTWEVDVYKSTQNVWFTVHKGVLGISATVHGNMEYNDGHATFNPKEVDIEFLG